VDENLAKSYLKEEEIGMELFSKNLIIVKIVLILILVSQQALSLVIARASIEELATESSCIILGEIISIESKWKDENHNFIYTYVTIEISEFIKGSGESQIVIRQMGGQINDIVAEIMGTPSFSPGEEVLLFLNKNENWYEIHSISLGCLRVRSERGEQKNIIHDLRDVHLIDPVTNSEVKQDEKLRIYEFDDFIDHVKSYIQ
jgi:hypothetical protein